MGILLQKLLLYRDNLYMYMLCELQALETIWSAWREIGKSSQREIRGKRRISALWSKGRDWAKTGSLPDLGPPDPMGCSGACAGSQSPTPDPRRGIGTPVMGCRAVLGGGEGCITYPASQLWARGQRSETPPGVRTGLWKCGGTWGEEPAISTPVCLEHILRSGTIRKKWWSRH